MTVRQFDLSFCDVLRIKNAIFPVMQTNGQWANSAAMSALYVFERRRRYDRTVFLCTSSLRLAWDIVAT